MVFSPRTYPLTEGWRKPRTRPAESAQGPSHRCSRDGCYCRACYCCLLVAAAQDFQDVRCSHVMDTGSIDLCQ
ncbi:hypothetical protein LZ30DRAFT_736658 [Colletotrichum cereale]|nr:hypothetical protein LZ30DRAFT_736658 [Colletotrichum cereale]